MRVQGLTLKFGGLVHVRCYVRFRFNRWENVCEHCRSYPGQGDLFH